MAYTNKGNVQKYLNVDIASTFDAQIDAWIAAVQQWIDRYTEKTFEAGATETDRYFDTYGGKSVFVDPFVGTIPMARSSARSQQDRVLTT